MLARDRYRFAHLVDPEDAGAGAGEPWDPPQGANGRLVLTHGSSCNTAYEMGGAPDVLLQDALGQGFAVASHALDHAGHNCNLVTQAESLVMTKERVAEQLGEIRWTIGTGCSGGSLTQQQVANAYPGVYDGILPQCSFTDAWSTAVQYVEYVGLRNYLEGPGSAESGITPANYPRVYGHPNPANPITFTEVIPNSGKPDRPCPGVAPEDVYDPATGEGVRCTLHDYMVNVFGTDPETGFARRPVSNVGVQYGLSGLQEGSITPAQFVALNEGVGGFDDDLRRTDARTEADPLALERVYRSGAVNTGAHLGDLPIIDLRGPDPGAFHDVYRTNSMIDRLVREHGDADNHVRWEGPVPLLGSTEFVDQGIRAMDAWLAAVEADTSDRTQKEKVVAAKDAAGVADRCTTADGEDLPYDSCPEVDATVFSSPRIEAFGGADVATYADDTLQCALVGVDEFPYANVVPFTDAQRATLDEVFPTGVCAPGGEAVGRTAAVTWLDYTDVVGGEPLGAPPVSRALGDEPDPVVPEAPLAVVLPLLALAAGGGALVAARRRQAVASLLG